MKTAYVLMNKRYTNKEVTTRYNLVVSATKEGILNQYRLYKDAFGKDDAGIEPPFETADELAFSFFYNRIDAGTFEVLTFEELPLI